MADTHRVTQDELDGLLGDVDRCIEHAISAQCAPEPHWQLESFRDLLGALRSLKFALAEIAVAPKPSNVERIQPGGGRK